MVARSTPNVRATSACGFASVDPLDRLTTLVR